MLLVSSYYGSNEEGIPCIAWWFAAGIRPMPQWPHSFFQFTNNVKTSQSMPELNLARIRVWFEPTMSLSLYKYSSFFTWNMAGALFFTNYISLATAHYYNFFGFKVQIYRAKLITKKTIYNLKEIRWCYLSMMQRESMLWQELFVSNEHVLFFLSESLPRSRFKSKILVIFISQCPFHVEKCHRAPWYFFYLFCIPAILVIRYEFCLRYSSDIWAFPVQDPDGNNVVNDVIFGPGEKKYRYCKVWFHFSKCQQIALYRLVNYSSWISFFPFMCSTLRSSASLTSQQTWWRRENISYWYATL
jgi:hypothetical protein